MLLAFSQSEGNGNRVLPCKAPSCMHKCQRLQSQEVPRQAARSGACLLLQLACKLDAWSRSPAAAREQSPAAFITVSDQTCRRTQRDRRTSLSWSCLLFTQMGRVCFLTWPPPALMLPGGASYFPLLKGYGNPWLVVW